VNVLEMAFFAVLNAFSGDGTVVSWKSGLSIFLFSILVCSSTVGLLVVAFL
jgi:hypothetical protein